jgi:hypothetical protein
MMDTRFGTKNRLTYKAEAKLRDALAEIYPNGRSRRADGRHYDTGLIRPYRPKPGDFREVYIRMGWDGIEEHYGTNTRVIRRWIEEEGRRGLVLDRAAYVERQRSDRRARRQKLPLETRIGPESLRRSDLHPEMVAEIFAMVDSGLSQAEVSRRLGIDDSTVSRTLSQETFRTGVTAVKPGRATG